MNINDYIKSGVLEEYCLGLTSEEETREVERLAAKYPKIRENLQELCKGIESYAEAHSIPPPERLKAKVVRGVDQTIHRESFKNNNSTLRYLFPIAASIALLVLSGTTFLFYQNQRQAQKDLSALNQQVQRLQKDYASLTSSHQNLEAQYVLLKDVGTHHVQMAGSHHAPKAQCVLYWNPEHKGAYLNIINLPNPPHGHAYQVWADVEGHHHNMGLINMAAANPDSSFLHPLPYIEDSRGFVITLEKQGGSPHPTVEKLFVKGNL